MIKKAWNKTKKFGRNCVDFGVRNAKRIGAVTTGVSATVMAQAQVTSADLTAVETAVSDVDAIWGTVATIIIGVAVVMVGKKFLRRTAA